MITSDTHSHTYYSHAAHSAADMARAAEQAGLKVYGFTEHSPRPAGCDYPVEYREHLSANFSKYLQEVRELRAGAGPVEFLLGLEVDWIEGEQDFARGIIAAEDYDYVLGSVHFIGRWPLDAVHTHWQKLDEAGHFQRYQRYFEILTEMAESRLMHIAAHPDIIKIFSVDTFRKWLAGENLELVRGALTAMHRSGMSMEVSAAGLRKPCKEIYPGPILMGMARELALPISFASDAHDVSHVGWKFDELAEYGRSFGYTRTRFYRQGQAVDVEF